MITALVYGISYCLVAYLAIALTVTLFMFFVQFVANMLLLANKVTKK